MEHSLEKYRSLFLLTTFLVFVNSLTLKAQLIDDFSDGDFTAAPSWTGDNAFFVIDANQLRSNSAVAASYYLSTPSTLSIDAQWEFSIDFQLATSGVNYAHVFLMADNADLNAVTNGYYIKIGGTADEISFYKVVSGIVTLLIDGTDGTINSSSSNPFNIRVIRTVANDWSLEIDDGATGSYINDGVVNDNSISSSTHFGVFIEQSSAASAVNGHYFDNFSVGAIPVDLTPPDLISTIATSFTDVDLTFTEPLDLISAQTSSNYNADGGLGTPFSATLDGVDPTLVHLSFSTPFVNGQTYTLTSLNIEDLSGNTMITASSDFMYFVPDIPNYREVVINEILADPTPQIGLLDAEFIEVLNTTSTKYFDLSGWEFSDGSSTGSIGSYALGPGAYVILVATGEVANFSPLWPNVIGVTSFPSLNNAGENITLKDASGNLIDAVNYTDSWYQDIDKEDGGWSLEQINPDLPCSSKSNWRASDGVDGGTPGVINALFNNTPDTLAPSLNKVTVIDNTTLLVHFTEEISNPGAYVVAPFVPITSATVSVGNPQDVVVVLASVLDTGFVYSIAVTGASDCSGNTLPMGVSSFVLPSVPRAKDIIINEVLFNPLTGGADFVECYNNSDRFIDVHGFYLANYSDDTISNAKYINANFILNPQGYVVFTEDSNAVKRDYLNAQAGRFVQTDLPTYSNESGDVFLILPSNPVSDFFSYHEDMHFGLINNPDGISLERIDFNQSTNNASNWHSAAESVGFATPGFENSQYYPGMVTEDNIEIDPPIFSPDNDGHEDVIHISYSMDSPGYVGNVSIYDTKGRLIKSLVQNELLGITGVFTWDGITNDRLKARIGTYIAYFEVFTIEGLVTGVKKPFALAGQF
ncbi:MAG: hypothetical protein HOK65_13845 [Crocinitomicaceae bacterium]|nr:hypothetical protein [Crocinitomicaceae bacterium]